MPFIDQRIKTFDLLSCLQRIYYILKYKQTYTFLKKIKNSQIYSQQLKHTSVSPDSGDLVVLICNQLSKLYISCCIETQL